MSANEALRMTRTYLSCVTELKCGSLSFMTQLTEAAVVSEFDRPTTPIPTRLAAEG